MARHFNGPNGAPPMNPALLQMQAQNQMAQLQAQAQANQRGLHEVWNFLGQLAVFKGWLRFDPQNTSVDQIKDTFEDNLIGKGPEAAAHFHAKMAFLTGKTTRDPDAPETADERCARLTAELAEIEAKREGLLQLMDTPRELGLHREERAARFRKSFDGMSE